VSVTPVTTESVYALTGATLGPFNTVWPYNAPSDVAVYLTYDGVTWGGLLSQGADYTLTAYNPTLTNGGFVTLAAYMLDPGGAWLPGAQIVVARRTPRSQPSTFGEMVGFSPKSSEDALDNVERQVQEMNTVQGRTLRVPPGVNPPLVELIPSTLWGVDENGAFYEWPYGAEPNMLMGTDSGGRLKFWGLPNFPPSQAPQAYVENWGAQGGNLAFDSYPAFQAALHSGYTVIRMAAAAYRLSAGIVIPSGVALIGDAFFPDLVGGTRLVFDLGVATCVQVGDGGNLKSTVFKSCTVDRAAGTPGVGTFGVFVKDGYAVSLDEIGSRNHGIGFNWRADPPYGIHSCGRKLYTAAITNLHLSVNTWPELFISQSRFGQNGGADLNCTAYVRITGGGTAGAGPNGVFFSQCQFNQGVNAPGHGVEWVGVSHTDSNALEFKFEQCHWEGISGAAFYTDSSCAILNRLCITDCTINCPNVPAFALNAATQPADWAIHGNEFYSQNFILNPTVQFSKVTLSSNVIHCPGTLNIPANSLLQLFGNVWDTLTISGAGNLVFADRLVTGPMTSSLTGVLVNLNVDIGVSFGGLTKFSTLTAQEVEFGDVAFYAQMQSGNPTFGFDAQDYLTYNRSANEYDIFVGNNLALKINANGIVAYNSGVTLMTFGPTQLVSAVPIKPQTGTFAALPSPVTMGAGSRAFITDASGTPAFAGAAAGGGATNMPVYSDGAVWRYG
jgi:hypothetical protein